MQALPSTENGPPSGRDFWPALWLVVLFVAPMLAALPHRVYLTNDLRSLTIAGIALVCAGAWWASSRRQASGLRMAGDPLTEWSLLAFVALAVFSAAAAEHPAATLRWFVSLAVGVLVYTLAHRLAADERRLGRFLDVVVTVGSGIAAAQIAAWTFGGQVLDLPVVPLILNRNLAAMMLLLPWCLALQRIRGVTGSPPARDSVRFFLLSAALVLSRSRAAWLGIAVAVVAGAFCGRARLAPSPARLRGLGTRVLSTVALAAAAIATAVALMAASGMPSPLDVLGSLASPFEGSAGGRLRRWQNGLPLVVDHLWTGVGPGRWLDVFSSYRHTVVGDPAGYPFPLNGHLELVAEVGLPAYLVFAFFVWRLARPATDEPRERGALRFALLAWLVAAVFHTVFFIRLAQLDLWLQLALLGATRPSVRALAPGRERALAAGACALLAVALAVEGRFIRAALHDHVVAHWIRYDRPAGPLVLPSGLGALAPVIERWMPAVFHRQRAEALRRIGCVSLGRPQHLFFKLADRELRAGNPSTALTWLAAGERVVGTSPRATRLRCRAEADLGRRESARRICADGLARWNADPDLWLAMADLERDAGRPIEAMAAYRQARTGFRARLAATAGIDGLAVSRRQQRLLEHIAEEERALRRSTPFPRSEAEELEEIAWVPQIHKTIAADADGVYYSSNATGRYQLWFLPTGGTSRVQPRLVSATALAPFRLRRHPHRQVLYFLADHLGDARYQLHALDLRTSLTRRLTSKGRQGEYEVSPDGSKLALQRERRGRQELCVVDDRGRGERCLVAGDVPIHDLAWRPDAAGVVYVAGESDLVEIALDGSRRVVAQFPGQKVATPAFSPTGDRLLVVLRFRGGLGVLHEVDLVSGEARAITASDRDVLTPTWLDDRRILYRERVADRYELVRLDRIDGRSERVDADGVVYPVVRGGDAAYYLRSDPFTPISLERIAVAEPTPRRLLEIADPEPEATIAARRIDLAVADREVRAWLYGSPSDAVAPQPAVLWLHGAGAEFSPRWHPYAQALARAGLVFVALNVSDEEALDDADASARLAAQALEVEALRRRLVDEAVLDRRRIALAGVSRGTRIAHEVLARNAGAYAAVVEIAPAPSPAWRSPRANLPPTLVFLGEQDPFVDAGTRAAEIEAQGRTGTDVRVIRFTDEGHDLRSPANLVVQLTETVSFLRRAFQEGSGHRREGRVNW